MIRNFNKSPLVFAVSLTIASTGAHAISAGTDLNLSAKAAAGGMAGAAYTMPQEASAAVFGNPATLTQFKGFNMNFGASLISLAGVENTQYATITGGALDGSYSNRSTSDADNYIVPDFGLALEIAPGFVIGTGLEVDAGLGSDMRDDPVTLLGGAAGTSLPLIVEVISFNANLAAAYQVNDKLSLGAAFTVGFGLAQLGTAGPTAGLDGLNGLLIGAGALPPGSTTLTDFGGTSASVHDIGFGGSLGATYLVQDGVMLSAALKSPVEYNFRNIIHADPGSVGGGISSDGYQNLRIQQPLEAIVGVALDNVLAPGLLVELDAVWKNWSDASAYEDAYEDQWLLLLGTQYTTGDWKFRLGYSYAEDILKSPPNGTLGGLDGVGTVPLSNGNNATNQLSVDVVKIVQNSLIPTLWNHTVTAGVGYSFTENIRVDAYAAYAFGESNTDDLPGLSGAAAAALAVTGATGVTAKSKGEVDYELMVGAGINIAMP